jgi:hypothetical protein
LLFPSQRAEERYLRAETYGPKVSIDTIVQWIRPRVSGVIAVVYWIRFSNKRECMPEKKTAIVTKASRGIGAGLVGAFLKEAYIVVAAPSTHATAPGPTIGYRGLHRGFWIGEPTG